jgi:hypothetical protein
MSSTRAAESDNVSMRSAQGWNFGAGCRPRPPLAIGQARHKHSPRPSSRAHSTMSVLESFSDYSRYSRDSPAVHAPCSPPQPGLSACGQWF